MEHTVRDPPFNSRPVLEKARCTPRFEYHCLRHQNYQTLSSVGIVRDFFHHVLQLQNHDHKKYEEDTESRDTNEHPHDNAIHHTVTNNYVIDVTNTSNVKFYFDHGSFSQDSYVGGNATYSITSMTVIRLGDT